MNTFVKGDFRDHPPPANTTLMIADPPYGTRTLHQVIRLAVRTEIPSCIFMWPMDLYDLRYKPDQICHWVKPVSTKNTSRLYSRFVEVLAMYGVSFPHRQLHWSNRTGVFTDCLLDNADHPHAKPEGLIERLILNHWPGHGIVYDPCAGSGTVHRVCERLNIESYSVDKGE